jgi:murein DD-endopeptidase MepM/ murein hydrolase activator NlpD
MMPGAEKTKDKIRRAVLAAALVLAAAALWGGDASGAGAVATTPSIWPAKGAVTSGFGWRISPFGGGAELHQGIDIASEPGTPVVATADGEVVESGWGGDYGNMVRIDHGNGLATVYGHNERLAVNLGQRVQKGQVIAYAGSTGRSTGPHVHYEVRKDGAAVDPWRYLVSY